MNPYDKIIFVAQSGTCREQMAKQIMLDFPLRNPAEIEAKGLVVQFPEPINQKAEAVLISNGISTEGLVSSQLEEEDITDRTLIFTMEAVHREKILEGEYIGKCGRSKVCRQKTDSEGCD